MSFFRRLRTHLIGDEFWRKKQGSLAFLCIYFQPFAKKSPALMRHDWFQKYVFLVETLGGFHSGMVRRIGQALGKKKGCDEREPKSQLYSRSLSLVFRTLMRANSMMLCSGCPDVISAEVDGAEWSWCIDIMFKYLFVVYVSTHLLKSSINTSKRIFFNEKYHR